MAGWGDSLLSVFHLSSVFVDALFRDQGWDGRFLFFMESVFLLCCCFFSAFCFGLNVGWLGRLSGLIVDLFLFGYALFVFWTGTGLR